MKIFTKDIFKKLILLTAIILNVCLLGCGASKEPIDDIDNPEETNLSLKQGGINIICNISDDDTSYTQDDLEDTVNKLKKRVSHYTTMGSVFINDDEQIVVDIPGEYDKNIIDTIIEPGELYFCTLVDVEPTEEQLANKEYVEINDQAFSEYNGYYKIWLTGSEVADAKGVATTDEQSGDTAYVVSLDFTDEGAVAFGNMTSQHVGETTYIIYDNEIISLPTIQTAITGGSAQIDGMNDMEEAEALASTIRIGSLNLNLEPLKYKITDPDHTTY